MYDELTDEYFKREIKLHRCKYSWSHFFAKEIDRNKHELTCGVKSTVPPDNEEDIDRQWVFLSSDSEASWAS